MEELLSTIKEFTDKNTVHSYIPVYEKLFSPIKDNVKHVLEIGILQGGSIILWHKFFPNALIDGIDITPAPQVLKSYPKIRSILNDAYSDKFFESLKKDTVYDIMIDDGPHTLHSQIYFVQKYSQLLSDIGILVVEDIQDIKHIDVMRENTPDELKKYIEVYDRRQEKGRYDDILFVINKNKT